MKGTIAFAVLAGVMVGCSGGAGFVDADRAARLTKLAAGEAAQITAPPQRLTQQLNIASAQLDRGWYRDAQANLASARKTIETSTPEQMDDFVRIAGWVSISELSRRAGDRDSARAACADALKVLYAISPREKRSEYVRGVARELLVLDGKEAACKLLREGGEWAKSIDSIEYRRTALAAIARDLFLWDDYDGGRDVLRSDTDATWRTQTLLAMANQAMPYKSFGWDVGFQKNFKTLSAPLPIRQSLE